MLMKVNIDMLDIKDKELLNDYIVYLKYEKKLSDATYISYEYDLLLFGSYLARKGKSFISATGKDIYDYMKDEYTVVKTSSLARKSTSIKKFYQYLTLNNIIKDNPCTNIDRPKLKKTIPNVLSQIEVERLLDINLEGIFDYRNKAMLELMYSTGLRVSEVINLTFRDIDMYNNVVRCFGKGSKERIVPINDYALYYLKLYLDKRSLFLKKKENDYLFLNNHGNKMTRQGFEKVLNKIAEDAQLNKKVTPHMLRHSFATHMLDHGADLKSIQELLGHSDIITTKIYTHVSKEKIKDDYEKYHPRNEEF